LWKRFGVAGGLWFDRLCCSQRARVVGNDNVVEWGAGGVRIMEPKNVLPNLSETTKITQGCSLNDDLVLTLAN
jgi:hypothetical protein